MIPVPLQQPAVTATEAARLLGLTVRRVRQLAVQHPAVVAGERPLRIRVDELRQIRGASPAALAAAALYVCEHLVPKLIEGNRTPEVVLLLAINQMHPELRAARCYPEPLRRLRARAGLSPDPVGGVVPTWQPSPSEPQPALLLS